MQKDQWLSGMQKANPTESKEYLSQVYDDYIANPTVVNRGTPITPMDAKFNPDGMPLASHGQKTSYYPQGTSPNTAVDHITATNQSIGENKKQVWMTKMQQLNPNETPQYLSQVYDDYVSSPDRQNVDQQEQLLAMQKWSDHMYRDNKPTPETDPDEGKAGFDASDKMSMLGSSILGLGSGVAQGVLGIADLALKLPEHFGALKKGTVASLKEKEDRWFKQRKLLQEAYASHPAVTTATNMVGSIVPMLVGGELAAPKIAAKAATMADAIKSLPGVADGIGVGTTAMEKLLSSAARNGAQKFMTKVLPIIRHGAEGALYGAATYDPDADTEMKNAIVGAIASLALPGGGKVIKSLTSKLTPEIERLRQQYGITLPVMSKFNAFLSSIPYLGNGVKTAATQKEYIDNLGRQMANKISDIQEREAKKRSQYGKFLVGELKNAFEKNKETASEMYQKVSDEERKLIGTKPPATGKLKHYQQYLAVKAGTAIDFSHHFVDLTNVKQIAQNLIDEEQQKTPSLQNKQLLSRLTDIRDVQDMSYKDVQENRSAIGEEQGASVGREEGGYKSLYKGLSDALDDYAKKQGSNIKSLHDAANKFYKDKIVPFTYGKWKKFLAPDYDTDDFLKDFLKPEHPGRIQDILEKLPRQEGSLTASRAAIVHSALDDAELPTGGFNPEKFVKTLTKLGETNDVVFTPEQRGLIDGYGKLLQATKKLAPKWLENTPAKETFSMLRHGTPIVGLDYLLHSHPHLAIPLIAGATGFIRLLTSDTGRKLLLNLSKVSEKLSHVELSDSVQRAARIAASSAAPSVTAGL